MNTHSVLFPSTRRDFLRQGLRGTGFLAFSRVAPAFLTRMAYAGIPSPETDRTILVVLQLAGGNDGLNTVVAFEDDRYYRLRPKLAINPTEVIQLSNTLGFHPAMGAMAELYREGKLSIIQNVGYPNPNRSHFRSTEIWETASESDEYLPSGWLGRYFDNACSGKATPEVPVGIHIGDQLPQSFLGRTPHNVFGVNRRLDSGTPRKYELLPTLTQTEPANANEAYLQHTLMDALVTEERVARITQSYRPETNYPRNRLALALRGVAAMIAARLETRVFFVSHSGYDTHTNQEQNHRRLLGELSAALSAFQQDLEGHGLQDQVLTMTFSEFGRRPGENNGGGTDHGTAAPLFVMGSRLKSSLIGTPPDLDVGRNQDLEFSTDFRSVYGTIIERWFGCPSAPILGRRYASLPFV